MLPPLSDLPSEADQQLQRAYAMCMKMSPICGDDGPLVRGINKLSALLDTASCERLAQVPLVCLAWLQTTGFPHFGTNRMQTDALNDMFLNVAHSVLAPDAPPLDAAYIRNSKTMTICTLVEYLPERYGRLIFRVSSTGCYPRMDELVAQRQEHERGRVRKKVVSKCVLNCIRNVLEHARVEVRMVQRKPKAQRRKLDESMTHLSIDDKKTDSTHPTADAPDSPSDASRPPIASKAADECAVCLEALGPQRLLFENCGHARLCESCLLDVEHCPLCMARVGDRCMRIWV